MNNRKTWFRGAALAATAAIAITTAGCSAQGAAVGPNEDRPANEIHVAAYGDSAVTAEQAIAKEFNKTSKVKVIVDKQAANGTDYTTAIRTSLGTKNAPDIFMSWGAADIQQSVDAKAVLPLDDFIKEDPKLKSSFLPSVFNEEVIDGKSYGIPMRGVAPTFLFYNKKVLAAAGLSAPKTWDDLVSQVSVLKKEGVTPIALGGQEKWPTQMWYQYAYARQMGNAEVSKGLGGDTSVWDSSASKKALTDLSDLLGDGAFGSSFDSVGYSNGGTTALLSQGKAAYELMGTWNYATLKGAAPDFVKNDLGWVAFPTLDGGDGKSGEIAGNLSNYYNVAADTRYPDTVRDFLKELYSPTFLKAELALGNLPPTTDADQLISADSSLDAENKEYLDFVFNLVKDAPTFQLSWDQTVPVASKTRLTNAVASFFDTKNSDQFITQMQGLTARN